MQRLASLARRKGDQGRADVNTGYLVTASIPVGGLGGLLTILGILGAVNYLLMRYGRYPRDASGRPTNPLTRGAVKNDRLFAIPLMVAGCVGVVLLLVSAVK